MTIRKIIYTSIMLVISHRANGNQYPENTLLAINSVKKLKVDMIEIDIRVTKDSIAILRHDSFILNDGRKINITDLTLAELHCIDKEISTLEQALRETTTHYLIEIKPGVNLEPILDILSEYQEPNSLIITSFDFKLLKQIHNRLPNIQLAILERWSGIRASYRAKHLGTSLLIMNQRWLWSGFVRSIHRSGYKLITYTLNDSKKAKAWQRNGLQGVITDIPIEMIDSLKT